MLHYQTTMAAARALGMSQPAVSNALRQIEQQSGLALFERINNRLFPTEAARLIEEESAPLFAIHEALERRLADLREDKISRLHILSTPPLGHVVLPRALARFVARRKRVRCYLHVRELDDVIAAVENGSADLGFGLGLSPHPALEMVPLFQGEMVCVCRPDHPLASRTVVTPADLDGETSLVALEAEMRMGAAIRHAFAEAQTPCPISIETRYCETACALAAAGLGAAIVDPFSPAARPELLVKRFEPAIPSTAYAFWSARRQLSPSAQYFLQEARDLLRRDPPRLQTSRDAVRK